MSSSGHINGHGLWPVESTTLGRCTVCGSWWSMAAQRCGCGGALVPIDMKAHTESLPKKRYDTDKDKEGK